MPRLARERGAGWDGVDCIWFGEKLLEWLVKEVRKEMESSPAPPPSSSSSSPSSSPSPPFSSSSRRFSLRYIAQEQKLILNGGEWWEGPKGKTKREGKERENEEEGEKEGEGEVIGPFGFPLSYLRLLEHKRREGGKDTK